MSIQIGVKDSFSESELSLHETIRKLTKERDSALHQVAGLEVQVLELGQSKEDAITAIFQRGMSSLKDELLNVIEDQNRKIQGIERLVAPLLVERQIRLEKEASEKEAEEKEGLVMSIHLPRLYVDVGIVTKSSEKLRQGTLAQIKAFFEFHEAEWNSVPFWRSFLKGTIPFPMEEQV